MTTVAVNSASSSRPGSASTAPPGSAGPSSAFRLYNTNKYRRGNTAVYPRGSARQHAATPVRLIPIRLDLEVDGTKIRDSFTWNLNERLTTPELFAQLLIEDIVETPSTHALVSQIADSIRKQCQAWENAVNDDEDAVPRSSSSSHKKQKQRADASRSEEPSPPPATEDPEWRTIIKLDLQVGQLHLVDQFEWPLTPSLPATTNSNSNADEQQQLTQSSSIQQQGLQQAHPTPESFARQLCADLGIGGEFVSIIAHSIREQICYARLNFDEAPKTDELEAPPVRAAASLTSTIGGVGSSSAAGASAGGAGIAAADEWNPLVQELSAQEIDRRIKEQERSARRLRRSQRVTTTIVMNRGGGGDGADDDDSGTARRPRGARNSSSQAVAMMGGQFSQQQQQQQQQFQHAYNAQMMMGGGGQQSYTSFSALPPQYASMYASGDYGSGMYGTGRGAPYTPRTVPYRNYRPTTEEEEAVLRKLEESVNLKALGPQKEPPKVHRGFGASANRFNVDGSLDVGEFRAKWRCSWCLLSGKFTPTLRRGPMGSKTLCNACGIWYGKHGSLPQERYHEHANDQNGGGE